MSFHGILTPAAVIGESKCRCMCTQGVCVSGPIWAQMDPGGPRALVVSGVATSGGNFIQRIWTVLYWFSIYGWRWGRRVDLLSTLMLMLGTLSLTKLPLVFCFTQNGWTLKILFRPQSSFNHRSLSKALLGKVPIINITRIANTVPVTLYSRVTM